MKKNLPDAPGVYIFRDIKGEPLYVGKAVNLKNRVRSYFHPSLTLGPKTKALVKKIAKIEHIEVESEIEALILEADIIKHLRPYYNSQWRDDKRYKFIKITKHQAPNSKQKEKEGEILSENFARITTTRKTDDKNAYYFGPFPEGRTVNKVLSSLRKIFGFADCSKTKFKRYQKLSRGCLYADLNLCPAPCAGLIPVKDYQRQIKLLAAFLAGKKKKVQKDLQKEMKRAAKEKNFEEAARLRDEIKRMEYITQSFRDSSEYLQHPNLLEDQRREELKVLLKELSSCQSACPVGEAVLGVKLSADFRIEAYDISNISGKQATGSRVVFINGEPVKSEYRRYRITVEGQPDDIGMMREVLERRFKPKKQNHQSPSASWRTNHQPDLILVDGGIGQLNTVREVLEKYNLKIPVVALAKKVGTISLKKDSPALRLLQRIRDEAHRFAVSYHKKLREKELFA